MDNNKQGLLNFLFKILQINFYPDNLEHIQFDPRQGYYQSSCLQKSGLPLWNKSCDLVGLGLITNCEESVMTALDLSFFKDWIRTAISNDIMKKRKWRKSKVLKDIFLNDLKTASSCQIGVKKYVPDSEKQLSLPNSAVSQSKPKFQPLSENLRVITDCGVEIRLDTGMIHSPIHYRDVKNSKELLDLFQTDFRYQPNQKCEWLITAPRNDQKVGIKFKYFDLHPDFDRLEIEEPLMFSYIHIKILTQNQIITVLEDTLV